MSSQLSKGYVFGLAAVLIWCGFVLVSRLGGISALSYWDVIALRYATCALVLLPVWWLKLRFNLFQRKYWLISLIGGLGYALCTFQGFQLAPASHGALLLPGAMPLFMFVFALAFSQLPFSGQKTLGISVITLGIAALFFQQNSDDTSVVKGDILFLIGAFCWGLFSVLVKQWNITPWQATISVAILTALMYLPYYVIFADKHLSFSVMPEVLTQMIYQGVLATIVQLLLFLKAIEIIGTASMGALMAFVPLFSGVSAIFVFNEPYTIALLSGLLLVAVGAWISHSKLIERYFLKINFSK